LFPCLIEAKVCEKVREGEIPYTTVAVTGLSFTQRLYRKNKVPITTANAIPAFHPSLVASLTASVGVGSAPVVLPDMDGTVALPDG